MRKHRARRISILTVLALGGALGGCVNAPRAPNARVSLPPTWRGAAAVEAGASVADDRVWWSVFGDPELDALILASLSDNLSIQQAVARLDEARALVRPARAEALPQVTASASARFERRLSGSGRTGVDDLPDNDGSSSPAPDRSMGVYQAGFDASWEPDLFARARNSVRSARASAGIVQADLGAIRVATAAEVARAYLELRSAQHRRGLLLDIEAAQRQTLTALEDRRAVGLASNFDVDRALSALADTAALIPREAAQIDQAGQRIALLLGTASPPPALLTPKAPPETGRLAFSTIPADLVRMRPEILGAEQAVLQAAAEAGVARADLYPRLTLGGALTLSHALGLSGGPALSIPLFDWGARRAIIDARDARLAAAVTGYRLAVLEGVAEVESALASVHGERARVTQLLASVAAARRAADNSGRLLEQGFIDVLDRLAAEAALRQAELNLSEARLAEAVSIVALHKALGGSMPDTEERPHSAIGDAKHLGPERLVAASQSRPPARITASGAILRSITP